jgi:hypothetical protein
VAVTLRHTEYRRDLERVAGPCDAGGNLAAIRDEKTAKSVHGRAR